MRGATGRHSRKCPQYREPKTRFQVTADRRRALERLLQQLEKLLAQAK